MPTFQDLLTSFAAGVITSGKANQLNKMASPRGLNAYLADAGPDGAVPATRRGLTTVNTTQIANTPIHAQFPFRILSSGTYTRRHLLFGLDGRVGYIESDPGAAGTFTLITATGLTASSPRPDIVQANNLAFVVNGTNKQKVRATSWQNFGITAPATAPTLAAGAAGTPSGTYEARVTYYNGNTGHESSAGPTSSTVTVVSQIINFSNVPVSADSQVTARRIYLRNTGTLSNFYLAATINDNSTTTASFNAADSTLLTLGPDNNENDPPPTGVRTLAWHRARMFAADDTKIYWSKIGLPEAFDPVNFEYVNPNDGQKIIKLFSYGDLLLIFKERSLYGLFGVDPETWQVRLLSADIGATGVQAVAATDTTLFWWSEKGPIRWSGPGSKPELIGQALLRDQITPTALAFSEFDEVSVAVDPVQEHVLFAVAENGKTRNTMILPWSYRLNAWVSSKWDPLGGVASLCTVIDDQGRPWVYYGSYAGQVFRAWDTDTDGVPSGTTSGTFTAGGTSITTITSSGFFTTGSALVERMVSVVSSDGTLMGRRYITSNTATVLTLDSAITGLTSGATYTFYVGGPNFEWDTRQEDSGAPFTQKRYEFCYVQVAPSTDTITVWFFANTTSSSPRSHSVTPSSSTQEVVTRRLRAAKTGATWQVRVMCRAPEAPQTLYQVGCRGITLSDHVR
ncbi:MAG TPA: hypothetical protein VEI97_08615 [bacterium]|nr:hypothetical protein [bacterium]